MSKAVFKSLVRLDTQGSLQVSQPLELKPTHRNILYLKIRSSSNCIECESAGSFDSEAEARFTFALEFDRVVSLMSLHFRVPVMVGQQHHFRIINGNEIKIHLGARPGILAEASVTLGRQRLSKFARFYSVSHPKTFLNLTMMWQEIANESSSPLKYLLLYRLAEELVGGSQKAVDNWIQRVEPRVSMKQNRRNKNRRETIYTHLRNQIHPGRGSFPRGTVAAFLPRFDDYVYELLREKLHL